MTFRLVSTLIYAGLILLTLAVAAAVLSPAYGHDNWIHKHDPACCTPTDCRKIAVRFIGVGWVIVWVDNPPHLNRITLNKKLLIPLDKVRPSQDREWWACFRLRDGVAVDINRVHNRLCAWTPGSGQ